MTFDEWFNSKQGEPYDSMYVFAKDAWAACSASMDAEVSRLVEKCHDFAAQHETDSGIIESDGKEIHFLREQRDQLQREVAELKSKLFDLTKQRDALSRMADSLEQERDQLHEQVAMLRDSICYVTLMASRRTQEALAATEPK